MSLVELFTVLVGILAGVLTVAFGIPQAVRVVRARSAVGVSAPAWWLTIVLCLTWLGYGIQIQDWVLIVSNAATIIAPAVILFVAAKRWTVTAAGLAATCAVVLGVSLTLSPQAAGFIAASLLATTRIPQVIASYRAWRDQVVTVVSTATWALSLTFSGLWVLYGVLNNDWAQILGNAGATVLSLLVLGFEVAGAQRAKRG